MIKRYLEYIKENPKRYWFRAKWYGWGWVPATWQGWLTIVIYIALVSLVFESVDRNSHSVSDTLYGVSIPYLGLTALLIIVCYLKGEKPCWSWGKPRKKK